MYETSSLLLNQPPRVIYAKYIFIKYERSDVNMNFDKVGFIVYRIAED